jgi:hypothetical protein
MDDLEEVCSSVLDNQTNEDQMERLDKDAEEEESGMTYLQHMLDEEDAEVDPGENEGCKSDNNQEMSAEEYNDIRCTQRKMHHVPKRGKKDGGSNDTGEESDVSEAEISSFFHDDSFNVEPCEDKVGLQVRSESKDTEGIKEAKDMTPDQSTRNEILKDGRNISRKGKCERKDEESEEDMEVGQRHEGKRKKARKERDERHEVDEKYRDSIVYQDEDVIIYSETEDTPDCSESEVNKQRSKVSRPPGESETESKHNCSESEVHNKISEVSRLSGDVDRSGSVSSPVLVDSDDSSHGSQVGSDKPDGEDSSSVDLFESPWLLDLSPRADDSHSESHSPSPKSPKQCGGNSRGPSEVTTPVRVSLRGGSRKIMRSSNLDRERFEVVDQQESGDPRSNGMEDLRGGSGDEPSSSCEDNDVVSLIDEEDDGPEMKESSPVPKKKLSLMSPVFQPSSKERKTFRFTKTKTAAASSQEVMSPRVTEKEDVICCDDDKSLPEKSSSQQHKNDVEDLTTAEGDEMGMFDEIEDICLRLKSYNAFPWIVTDQVHVSFPFWLIYAP